MTEDHVHGPAYAIENPGTCEECQAHLISEKQRADKLHEAAADIGDDEAR